MPRRPCSILLALVLAAAAAAGQGPPSLEIAGPLPGAGLGAVLADLGDLDGDGASEIGVGAPFAFGGAGAMAVVSGATGALMRLDLGVVAGGGFGSAIAALDDVDGDGSRDYAVGEPLGGAQGEGAVRLLSGQTGASLGTLAPAGGAAAGDRFGYALAAADVDGDGQDELVVGAPFFDAGPGMADAGRVQVFDLASGASVWSAIGSAADELHGNALARVGDLNGNGGEEIVVGARWYDPPGGSNNGRALVLDLLLDVKIFAFGGEVGGDQLGVAVAGGGDVDGDGVPDVVLGAQQNDHFGVPNVGRVYVHSGADGTLLHVFTGEVPQDHVGSAVACLGDVDADGFDDVALGGLTFPVGAGHGIVQVHSGQDGAILFEEKGAGALELLGYAVTGLGDVDGDGIADFAYGSPFGNGVGGAAQGGFVRVRSICGVRPYGAGSGVQPLAAAWTPASPAASTLGALDVTGAGSGAGGWALVGLEPASLPMSGIDLLVDPPTLISSVPIAFDAAGASSHPLNLRQPALADVALFVQFLAFDALGGASASNGSRLAFCR